MSGARRVLGAGARGLACVGRVLGAGAGTWACVGRALEVDVGAGGRVGASLPPTSNFTTQPYLHKCN